MTAVRTYTAHVTEVSQGILIIIVSYVSQLFLFPITCGDILIYFTHQSDLPPGKCLEIKSLYLANLGTNYSVFLGVGIEEFHHVYRDVLISGCWNRGVPPCIQRCPHFGGLE